MHGEAVKAIRFGVSRAHGGAHLVEATRAFTSLLEVRLGISVHAFVARDYEHLLEGVLVSGIALAWMPPLIHARAVEEDALLAAVLQRGGAVTFRTALLVHKDSSYRSRAELKGARAAWSDPASASGHIYPRMMLGAGLQEAFYGSAAAALEAVMDGRADVCACFVSDAAASDETRALADVARISPPAAFRLRVLEVSEPIPPDGVVLAPALDGGLQARLRDTLLGLHAEAAGAAVVAELFNAERLVPVTPDVIRAVDRLRALAARQV